MVTQHCFPVATKGVKQFLVGLCHTCDYYLSSHLLPPPPSLPLSVSLSATSFV